MAQAHVRLGVQVTVIEAGAALGREDPEAAALVLGKLRAEGVTVLEHAPVTRVGGGAGALEVHTGDGQVVTGTHLLVAAGRRANIDRLNLEAAGIRTTRTGIEVDAGLRTSNRRVYAIGDVAGGLQFTHVAGYHAGVVIRSALFGLPARASHHHVPRATYTDPELAQIGLTEAEARVRHGDRVELARFNFHHNDRLLAERRAEGFIKVMVVKGRPVGATLVGPQAGEQGSLWSMALANRLKMGQIAGMIAPYPTVGEVNKRAAGAYFSPRLFENRTVKRVVGAVQRWMP